MFGSSLHGACAALVWHAHGCWGKHIAFCAGAMAAALLVQQHILCNHAAACSCVLVCSMHVWECVTPCMRRKKRGGAAIGGCHTLHATVGSVLAGPHHIAESACQLCCWHAHELWPSFATSALCTVTGDICLAMFAWVAGRVCGRHGVGHSEGWKAVTALLQLQSLPGHADGPLPFQVDA
jgi:hypothetical protein